ncbi:hypothetical protein M9Y10_040039 [Tritrichomonas musculus]|uniref:Uncharacterized protein n=1 Tax=Tritrichomonas musculus TaxID=1915356 RepID=A0ABR2GR73_9EUKA
MSAFFSDPQEHMLIFVLVLIILEVILIFTLFKSIILLLIRKVIKYFENCLQKNKSRSPLNKEIIVDINGERYDKISERFADKIKKLENDPKNVPKLNENPMDQGLLSHAQAADV